MNTIQFSQKESFAVIGKLGEGDSARGRQWIAPLWQEANDQFGEIISLALKDAEGQVAALWGIMSDVKETFRPWDSRGKYLAGVEVDAEAAAPLGWTRWQVPGYRYLMVPCTMESYAEAFSRIVAHYLPDNGLRLVGAVHERYEPASGTEQLTLYFPIEKLK